MLFAYPFNILYILVNVIRFTPLSLYFILPGDGLIHVYSTNSCVNIQIVASTGKCTHANFGSFVLV